MRRSPLLAKPPPDHRGEPGYWAFKARTNGECPICGQKGQLLRHHVIREQDVRAAKGDPWALANSIWIGVYCRERCHRRHHSHFRQIPLALVPPEAREFVIEVLGEPAADEYLRRYYADG